jgi:hypothetical protein
VDLGRHGIASDRREPGFGKEALSILGQDVEFAQAKFMRPSEQGLKQRESHALMVWGYRCGTNQARETSDLERYDADNRGLIQGDEDVRQREITAERRKAGRIQDRSGAIEVFGGGSPRVH